jgi:hypothetical protein
MDKYFHTKITPFLISPKGEMMKNYGAPSPLGEGWDGGIYNKEEEIK